MINSYTSCNPNLCCDCTDLFRHCSTNIANDITQWYHRYLVTCSGEQYGEWNIHLYT